MPVSVTLPALGESVTEGTVTRWLKQVGDTVQTDEPLLEVSTDKVDTEIPAPTSGVLLQITVGEDETVAVGAELGVIGDQGDDAGSAGGGEAAPAEQEAEAAPAQEQEQAPQEEAEAQPQEQEVARDEQAASDQQAMAAEPEAEPAPADAGGGGGGAETSVTLPALGESVTEGTVTRWLKQIGDTVQTDEPLLEVSTDKVDTEIPAPASGTLLRITVGEDETVAVGAELGVIGSDQAAAPKHAADEPAAPAAPEQPQAEPVRTPEPPAPPAEAPAAQAPAIQPPAAEAAPKPAQPAEAAPPNGDGASQYVTPLVRKLANEHDIDLTTISGTGVGGRIRKQDVLAAAEAKKAAAAAPTPAAAPAAPAASAAPAAAADAENLRGTTQKLTRMRKIIAQRLVESMQVSAQLTTVVEVDVTQIARLRNKVKNDFQKQNGVKLSFLPFFAKAAIEALKVHPKLNASMDVEKGEVTYHDAEHLVVAVDTERGLLVPVVHNAGDLNIAGLTKKIADLAERARTNKLVPDELAGGTFTLTNTGSRGALFDTPIFFQPQVAILGTGSVVKRAVVIDDEDLGETIAVRHMMYLALSYDHRLVDGADAARFLGTIKERLEDGKFEAEFGL